MNQLHSITVLLTMTDALQMLASACRYRSTVPDRDVNAVQTLKHSSTRYIAVATTNEI
jgi:hypothetical protein